MGDPQCARASRGYRVSLVLLAWLTVSDDFDMTRQLGHAFTQNAIVHLIDAGQLLALPSNQPVGVELPGGAGDQDFDDGDGSNRKEHLAQANQLSSTKDPDHTHKTER